MNKKSKVKTGLSFGFLMSVFFIVQNLLSHDDITTKSIITSITLGLFAGALSGLLFGLIMGIFAKSKIFEKGTSITPDEDENILFETPANHCKGVEAVGGKLYLTSKRLIFKSHKLNIQNHQLALNIPDIKKIDRYKTMGFINNGLFVTTINGSKEKFIVQQPDNWFHYLTDKSGLQQKYLQ